MVAVAQVAEEEVGAFKWKLNINLVFHSSFTAKTVKMLMKVLAYNIVNIMKRIILSANMHKVRLSTIIITIIKIACKL